MALTRATGRGDTGESDEAFMEQLYRGGELLTSGQLQEALAHLEQAHALQPRNEKGQNLLGLAYFKLSIFDKAAEIYELLVRDNPVDPTLRVNLGLVYLKSNSIARAVREFETAVDLAPEHLKAQNYLGLALAQAGEYGRAREHFLLAGSEAMAEKMTRALAGEAQLHPAPTRPPPLPPQVPSQRVAVEVGEPPPEAEVSFADVDPGAPPPTEQVDFDAGPSTLVDANGESVEPVTGAAEETPLESASGSGEGEQLEPVAGASADDETSFADVGEAAASASDPSASAGGSGTETDETSFADVVPEGDAPPPDAAGWSPPMQESAGEQVAETPPADSQPLDVEPAEGASPALTQNDWGAQFGFDPANAPAPNDPFARPPEAELVNEESAGVQVQPPSLDVALEVAAISTPNEEAAPVVAPPEPESTQPAAEQTSNEPEPEPQPEPAAEAERAGTASPSEGESAPATEDEEPVVVMGEPEVEGAGDAGEVTVLGAEEEAPEQSEVTPAAPAAAAARHAPMAQAGTASVSSPTPVPLSRPSAPVRTQPAQVHMFLPRHPAAAEPARSNTVVAPEGVRPSFAAPAPAAENNGPPAAFTLMDEAVVITVQEELLSRTEGVVAVTGALNFTPEPKRFRGRPTDKPFGEGRGQMARVKGQGTLIIRRAKASFVPLTLSDHSVYLREEYVFAFEEAVTFENGRVPSDVAPDLNLVHLSGEGQVLLRVPGEVSAVDVQMDAPVVVPLNNWVGWQGNVTPRVLALGFPGVEGGAGVELTGEGQVFLTLDGQ